VRELLSTLYYVAVFRRGGGIDLGRQFVLHTVPSSVLYWGDYGISLPSTYVYTCFVSAFEMRFAANGWK
jgi:hypothetical protein